MDHEFLIVALVPEPLCSVVETLRRRYDRWSSQPLPPHITMIRPLRSVPERLRQRASQLDYPFTITLQGWYGFRNPGQNVVWLDPGQDEPCRVVGQISGDFPELSHLDNGRYQPGRPPVYHITVANHIPDADFPSVMAQLRRHEVPGTVTLQQLKLLQRELPDGEWQLI